MSLGPTHDRGRELSGSIYREGLPVTATHCPRCGQLLIRRGEHFYCLYGCTREWPIRGGSVERHQEYERHAGGTKPNPTLAHEAPGRLWRLKRRWQVRPERAPRGIKVAPGVRA